MGRAEMVLDHRALLHQVRTVLVFDVDRVSMATQSGADLCQWCEIYGSGVTLRMHPATLDPTNTGCIDLYARRMLEIRYDADILLLIGSSSSSVTPQQPETPGRKKSDPIAIELPSRGTAAYTPLSARGDLPG